MAVDIVLSQELERACKDAGFEKVLVVGRDLEILEPSSLGSLKRKLEHGGTKLIFVRGGDLARNRIGVRDTGIDYLLDPVFEGRGFDPQIVSVAKENDVGLAFSFSSILSVQGAKRAALIGRIMDTIEIAVSKGLRVLFASFAENPSQIRTSYDLSQFVSTLGLTFVQARACLERV